MLNENGVAPNGNGRATQKTLFDCRGTGSSRLPQKLQHRRQELQTLQELMCENNVRSSEDISSEIDRLERREARMSLKILVGNYVDAKIGESPVRVFVDRIGSIWAYITIFDIRLRIPVVQLWNLVVRQQKASSCTKTVSYFESRSKNNEIK